MKVEVMIKDGSAAVDVDVLSITHIKEHDYPLLFNEKLLHERISNIVVNRVNNSRELEEKIFIEKKEVIENVII